MRRLGLPVLALALACGDDDSTTETPPMDLDQDGAVLGADCNDTDGAIHPGAEERCNEVDDDCDGRVDEDAVDEITVFTDRDGDGYGDFEAGVRCRPDAGEAALGGDCDDGDPGAHPAAAEICNDGIDDDCNGAADDEDGAVGGSDWYADFDKDGYGGGVPLTACLQPSATLADGTDCDDSDAGVHPGAVEICNGFDDDCNPASSETGLVSTDGALFWSIQDAIDAAEEGSTISLCEGLWYENLEIDKHMVLEGVGADVSIIDGADVASVVEVQPHIHVTLRNLTLQHGWTAGSGGGIGVSEATLKIEDCVVTENRAEGWGGGIASSDTDLLIDRTIVSDNAASWGGGAWIACGNIRPCEVIDSEIRGNHASEGVGGGLAVWASGNGGSATFTRTTIDGNWVDPKATESSASGGGIYSMTNLSLNGVVVSNNEAPSGAGIYLYSSTAVADDTTEIVGNATYDEGAGGGVYLYGSAGWRNGHVTGNTAAYGGGIYFYSFEGTLSGVVVDGNHATDAGGGLWVLDRTRDVNLVTISGNTSDGVGGGIFVSAYGSNATPTFEDCVVDENVAATEGGGLWTDAPIESVDTDWGSGATDNAPDDLVYVYSDAGDSVTYDFEGVESFVCDAEAQACE
jgi:hypothetical protein